MFQFRTILKALVAHDVEFILVGGLAGVLQGAPVNTKDVDILYSLEEPNPERLMNALIGLDARFRDDPRNISPNLSHLNSKGHKLLTTAFGDLDCLGTIEESTTYQDVLPDVDQMTLDDAASASLNESRRTFDSPLRHMCSSYSAGRTFSQAEQAPDEKTISPERYVGVSSTSRREFGLCRTINRLNP